MSVGGRRDRCVREARHRGDSFPLPSERASAVCSASRHPSPRTTGKREMRHGEWISPEGRGGRRPLVERRDGERATFSSRTSRSGGYGWQNRLTSAPLYHGGDERTKTSNRIRVQLMILDGLCYLAVCLSSAGRPGGRLRTLDPELIRSLQAAQTSSDADSCYRSIWSMVELRRPDDPVWLLFVIPYSIALASESRITRSCR